MGKEKRITIRLCDRTMMIIDELTEHANVTKSAFIRYIIDRTLDKLIAKEGYIDENKTKVLITHPASAGHGLNLQAGGHIIVWFGVTWSLELYQQANARLHRQGQTKPVMIYHLITKGTMDERVMKAIANKENGQNAMIDAVRAIMNDGNG